MKTKKIRGHKRRWKHIDYWVEAHRHLDLDALKAAQRDYSKIRVHPWSGFSMTNSQTPEPNGKTRAKMLAGLFEIYNSWKSQLEQLNEPYYLKVWLYEPWFSRSQVVCAIGNYLSFYETTFFKPKHSKELNAEHYGHLAEAVSEFNWEYGLDEVHLNNADLGSPEDYAIPEHYELEKRRIEKLLKKPHRTTAFDPPFGDATGGYSFKVGGGWIGGK